jgi:hypothetical protein
MIVFVFVDHLVCFFWNTQRIHDRTKCKTRFRSVGKWKGDDDQYMISASDESQGVVKNPPIFIWQVRSHNTFNVFF